MDKEKKFITAEKTEINEIEQSIIGWGSKPIKDRDDELIESSAWKLDSFRKNPVIMLCHDYTSPPVGKALWVKADSNGLKFKAKFANTERGREVYQLFKEGIMSAFSVGFKPNRDAILESPKDGKYKDMGLKRVYTDVELLEISCVPIPSNSEALVEAVKSGRIKTKELKEELEAVIEIITKDVEIEMTHFTKCQKCGHEFSYEDQTEISPGLVECPSGYCRAIVDQEGTVKSDNKEDERVKLPEQWVEYLKGQPESGQGYHLVIITFADGATLETIVQNCEEIKLPPEFAEKEITEMAIKEKSEDHQEQTEEVKVEDKAFSPDGDMSVWELLNAVNEQLKRDKKGSPDGSYYYITDIYPTDFPSGKMIYSGNLGAENKCFYTSYVFKSVEDITINYHEEKIVAQEWLEKRYTNKINIGNFEKATEEDTEEKDSITGVVPTVYEIMSALENIINVNGCKVIDLIPTDYPNGSLIYMAGDELEKDFFVITYTITNTEDGLQVKMADEDIPVKSEWVEMKYGKEIYNEAEIIEKAGRSISAATKEVIKTGLDHIIRAQEIFEGLYGAPEEGDGGETKDADVQDDFVLELENEEDNEEIEIILSETSKKDGTNEILDSYIVELVKDATSLEKLESALNLKERVADVISEAIRKAKGKVE